MTLDVQIIEASYFVSPKVAECISGKDRWRIPVVPEQREGRAQVGEQEVEGEPVVVAQRSVHLAEIEDLRKCRSELKKNNHGAFLGWPRQFAEYPDLFYKALLRGGLLCSSFTEVIPIPCQQGFFRTKSVKCLYTFILLWEHLKLLFWSP